MGTMTQKAKKKALVVVLGDIGRSPRMQYHALSLAEAGFSVNIIGYSDTKPIPSIVENNNIAIVSLSPLKIQAPKMIQYLLKAIWQFINLLYAMFLCGFCDVVLCQNPPSIPTLPACKIYCLMTRAKFIVDWHNYAYSIMALSLSPGHLLLKLSTWIETFFGAQAHINFCVTQAFKEDLENRWNIRATVLYDRPPEIFKPISLEHKHDFIHRLSSIYRQFSASGRTKLNLKSENDPEEITIFTQKVNGNVQLRKDRPGLLFSSTSWTPDEDFGILLESLQDYENCCGIQSRLPKLICVITGKGPLKEHYIELIDKKDWKYVKVVTPWLEATDYPKMVASADLGVCLHTSSSGLDLPMKVVDMFGAGLPVCAYNFSCLDELVKDRVNGYTFSDSSELSSQIVEWFKGFPDNSEQNKISAEMRRALQTFQATRWEQNWNEKAKKFFVGS